jgi:lysozyme
MLGFASPEATLLTEAALTQLYSGMQAVGADKVRISVYWQLLEPSKGTYVFTSSGSNYPGASLDQAVNMAVSYGLKPLLCLLAQPGLPMWSYQATDYGAAMAALATRYPSVSEFEVWNEPNGDFWPGGPNAAQYTTFLNAAHDAVKTVQPDSTVLVGGLAAFPQGIYPNSMDPVTFLQGIYTNGGKWDVVANHPYSITGAFVEEEPTPTEHYIQVDAQLYALMVVNGDGSKFIDWTEWGFSTLVITEAQQASWLAEQWTAWTAQPWHRNAYLFGFHDLDSNTSDPNNGFGITNFDYTPKPSYAWAKSIGGTVTLFGPDVSNNNFTSTAACLSWLAQLPGEGFSWVEQKVSEGNYYHDPYWPVVKQWCAQNDFLCIGYHYVTTNDPASQAQTYLAAGGGPNVMLDFEANSGDINNYWNVVNAFNAAGVTVRCPYIPHWYWQQIGSPDLSKIVGLISSSYVGGSGYASALYPGDNGAGWAAYGGAAPAIWQFTDQALVAGLSVDCNAFQGTLAQLAALLGSAPPPPPPTPPTPGVFMALSDTEQADLYNWVMWGFAQLVGFSPKMVALTGSNPTPAGQGWPQLGGLTVVDALAAMQKDLTALQTGMLELAAQISGTKTTEGQS